MSGFSAEWLALREPADHASINHQLRSAVVRHFSSADSIAVIDLGSGTGSDFRSVAPDLARPQTWTLVDINPELLDVAAKRCAKITERSSFPVSLKCHVGDLARLTLNELFDGANMITASALFDLVSVPEIERIVEAVTATGAVFYTTLTYDGIAAWLPEHHLNHNMRDAFNHHQKTDKGFGPAAGPDAAKVIMAAFQNRGYSLMLGASPWILDRSQAKLRNQTDRGWAAAVNETGLVSKRDIEDWLQARETARNGVSIIGHTDLLAIPPRGAKQ